MKKFIIGIFFLMLCAVCGVGAFFFLRQGRKQYEQELKPELLGLSDITIREGESLPESVMEVKGSQAVKKVEVDISKVNTKKEGEYPIYYHFTDQDGNSYTDEIRCTVEAIQPAHTKEAAEQENKKTEQLDRTAQESEKIDVPDSGTMYPPKTGEETSIIFYAITCVLSLAGIVNIICARRRNQKI